MKKYKFIICVFAVLAVFAVAGTGWFEAFADRYIVGVFMPSYCYAKNVKSDDKDYVIARLFGMELGEKDEKDEDKSVENLSVNYENYVAAEKKSYENQTVKQPVADKELILGAQETQDEEYISTDVVSGTIYSYNDLCNLEFLKSNFYTVTSVTSLNSQNFNPEEALKTDLSIEKKPLEPQILIFHSHSQETFVDSVEGDYSTYIVGVGDRLTQILTEKYGYNVIHDTTTYDILDGSLDRGKAYTYSNAAVERYLKEYPSIQVVLDVHRDGVDDSIHFVTEINGKPTAKIMFFNGISYTNLNGFISYLHNPYLAGNLAMSLQMQLLTKAYYPDFTRKVYIQGYRYSQHHADRSMLIEVGAQTNTVEEAKNAMEPLADTLDKLLSGQKAYQLP